MEPIRLKSGLFGFKRKQVLQYINGLCVDFQQQCEEKDTRHASELAAMQEEYESKLQTHEHAIAVQMETNRALEERLTELVDTMEQQKTALDFAVEQRETLSVQLEQANEKAQQAETELATHLEKQRILESMVAESQSVVTQQEKELNARTAEIARLQTAMTKLEDDFSNLRADTEQSTAMVNCLNLLHGRNRALTQKIARLEAQLEETRAGNEIQKYEQSVSDRQVALKNTETLFSTVRKEIQDALESISHKIEAGGINQTEDGNYFVDMAKL